MKKKIESATNSCNITGGSAMAGDYPSMYLMNCIDDHMISAETVLFEVLQYLSEDQIEDIIVALGLDEEGY